MSVEALFAVQKQVCFSHENFECLLLNTTMQSKIKFFALKGLIPNADVISRCTLELTPPIR